MQEYQVDIPALVLKWRSQDLIEVSWQERSFDVNSSIRR
jgi:hypothetical protein